MTTTQGFPVNNKQEIEELVYNTLNATVHLEDGAGNHITWSFANGDDALDLFDWIDERFKERPPIDGAKMRLYGGPFSYHTKNFPSY